MKRKNKGHSIKKILFLIPLFLLLLIFLYFILGFYYQGSFGPNTWINGVYATGQTIDDINARLILENGTAIITVKGPDGRDYTLNGETIGYSCDYRRPINDYLKDLNPLLWFAYTIEGQKIQVEPCISVNSQNLEERYNTWDFVVSERAIPVDARLELTDNGYALMDGYHNRYDLDKILSYLEEQIESGVKTVDLSIFEKDVQHPVGADYDALLAKWEAVQNYQNTGLIYDMGDQQIPLKGRIAADFLQLDDETVILDVNGVPVVDKDKVTAFISELAAEYDTVKKDREWTTYDGRSITVPAGTYGTQLNQNSEVRFILENLSVKEDLIRVPEYIKEGFVRGKDDIGNTYVEIDMTAQKLFVYQAGTCTIETDVVTGNVKRKWSTPDGVYFVYSKQRNRTLRGEGYATPVKYWMPVNGNIGLHDANWRKKFGGDIYQTDGSHGCVNIPKDIMPDIYEIVEKGTPVIMYY